MALREILIVPDPRLKQVSKPVEAVDDELRALMDGQRRLLHDVSHELRSPLARLQAAIGLAHQQPDRMQASLERIERESVRMDRLVGELLTLSRLEATTTQMRASSPPWLAEELTRSWRSQWPDLPDAMNEAAGYVAPTDAQLQRLAAPMGVAAARDDPIHPLDVGRHWAAVAPHAALRTVTLDQIGADPAALGAACLAALDQA